jgi:fructose-bisphosphate aldolase class II
MLVLRDVLGQAQKNGVAIGHFNIADLVILKAVFASARELKVPVMVGASEGEREFIGTRQIAALVRSLREEFDFPIFLNADHTHSLAKATEAARAGFDAIVFDASALPFDQNVRQTKEAVEALKAINPAILVEGEIGDIGTGSEIHEVAPDLSKGLTTPVEAKQFVESTGNLRKAIAAGINIIHINTELRVAWRRGLEDALVKQPHEVVPYKILPFAVESVKQVALSRLRLFNNIR